MPEKSIHAASTLSRPARLWQTRRGLSGRTALVTGAFALALGLTAAPALAVHAGHWVHDSEADFTAGKTQDAVVTNLGDVKLAAQSSVIGKMPEEATIIYDMQAGANGDIYVAAGPQAALLVRRGDKIEPLLKLEKEQIFSLDMTADGKLLVGISGAKSRLATLEKDNTLKTLVDLPDTRYIWDMQVSKDVIYLATGSEGKLLKVDLSKADKPQMTELLDAKQANLLCLTMDKQGRLFAGSDTDGLVYRVSFDKDGKPQPFVVYDADEPEVGALWLAADGTLYVGTADADQARPGRLEAASQGGQGRPAIEEGPAGPALAPDQKPKPPVEKPKPGDIPQLPPKPKPIEPPKPNQGPDTGEEAIPSAPAKAPAKPSTITPPPTAPSSKPSAAVRMQLIQEKISAGHGLTALQAGVQKTQGDKAQVVAAPAEPTAAQRDELRAVIRQRLDQARQSGAMQATPGGKPTVVVRRPGAPGSPMQSGRPRMGPGAAKPGNAVYRISPDGFVSEVFRESVMILHIAGLPDGSLLIATGNEGRLFRVDPAASEITRLVKLESQQITSILRGPDGDLLLGTANPATLAHFSPDFAKEGTFTSVVLDASQISLFGQINIVADIPRGTSVAVQTRSGNVDDPENGPWSEWSQAKILTADNAFDTLMPRSVPVLSPPARFLQYQLTLKSDKDQSPQVNMVDASFVVPNLKPVVSSITLALPGTPPRMAMGPSNPGQPQPIPKVQPAMGPPSAQANSGNAPATMNITWEAADPNNDQLVYMLEYRPAAAQVWLPLSKDIKENRYEWQTRRVPDGRYIVRVTASDSPDNTPDAVKTDSRASDPILVDNTPPTLERIKMVPGPGEFVITGKAKDALSTISGIQYVVDAAEQWQYVLPDDLIYDSTDESFTVKILDLAPGQHVITLRADDARGNAVHEALIVEIK